MKDLPIKVALSHSTSTLTQGLEPSFQSVHASARVYSTLPGFFIQDDPTATGITAVPPRFGLLDESPNRWAKFIAHIEQLNRDADSFMSYKVLFLGRHGQGFHNVAEAKYGTQAWNDSWSKLNGDGELVWGPDPELTSIGKDQAVIAHEGWTTERPFGILLPQKLYCSPLTRAMQTCEITFRDIVSSRCVVVECREENGIHTCDKRRTKTYIESVFPLFELELGFSEEDLLWEAEVRESRAHVEERAKEVLDMIFNDDKEIVVSVTAHGGIINAFLAVLGRPSYGLPTGGVLPVVVRSVYTP